MKKGIMKNSKKWLAFFLVAMMMVSLLQFPGGNAFAAEFVEEGKENRVSVSCNEATLEEMQTDDDLEKEDDNNVVKETPNTGEEDGENPGADQISGNDFQVSGNELETELLVDEMENIYPSGSNSEIVESGKVNNISWQLDSNGKLSITGSGDYISTGYLWEMPPWAKESVWEKTTSAVVNVSGMTSTRCMFYYFRNLKEVDLSGLDTSKVTSMFYMFSSCESLTSLDISHFKTGNVTEMNSMFSGCKNLTSLDISHFDTENVTDMSGMFAFCSKLSSLDVSNFDTHYVTDMHQMFASCFNLSSLNLNHFDTSNVTSMKEMFAYCSSLTSLDLSNFNTGKVVDMAQMFDECNALGHLNIGNFDTSNVTQMNHMFMGCNALKDLDVSRFDTGNVTDMTCMFYDCKNLNSLDLSNFDMGNVTETLYNMFGACDSLTLLLTPKNCMQANTLPVTADTDKWYDEDGTEYTELPMNLSHSIALYKNGYPGDGSTKKLVYVKDVNIEDKVYDAIPNLYTGTAVVVDQFGNPISGMTLTHSYSGTLADGSAYVGTTDAPSQAGNYTLSFQITGTDAEQYNLYKPSYRFRINRKEVTVTAESVKVEKGGQLPGVSDLNIRLTGFWKETYLLRRRH